MSSALEKIYERCWEDEAFKKRFLENPAQVLAENNFEVPEGVEVKVVENAPGTINIVLPVNPKLAELSEDELEQVAGGMAFQGVSKLKFDWSRFASLIQLKTKTTGKECVPW